MVTKDSITQGLSWCGVIMSLGSYFLLSTHIVLAGNLLFLCMNTVASIMLGIIAYTRGLPAIVFQNII